MRTILPKKVKSPFLGGKIENLVTLWFFEERFVIRAKGVQGPGSRQRRDWNHKALISPWRGRGKYPPPPPAETSFDPPRQGETQPMLPARSGLTPGPKQRRCGHFFKTLS